jgi:exodeoxyribonuclease VII small subunit
MKKEQTFEQSMQRLQEIVQLMENGDASLDKSLKLFEEGAKLADLCNTILKNAEQTIINITQEKQEAEGI